ncbi:chorismate mutase [Rhodopila sp.]|uniref:chorismate mutase n=1 Tax=Rhodopila sp. TaxID=2480087 RepID=UPI003D134C1E
MPSSVPTADVSPAASVPTVADAAEPAPVDGWRSGDLPALRAELDRIDNTLHDLLMERAGIVEYVARSAKPAAFRPGREASIIRRLLGRHRGALPSAAVVRIWRELLAGTTAMQGGFSLSVCDDHQAASLTQLAREHFGALTPLRTRTTADQALQDVSERIASVAVLKYPSEIETWWVALLRRQPKLHIIARMPFWAPRPDGAPVEQALVVAATPADASGTDHSFVGLQCDGDLTPAKLYSAMSKAGLTQQSMLVHRHPGSSIADVLVEVEGHLNDDDPRLAELRPLPRRPIVLGCYALPVGMPVR